MELPTLKMELNIPANKMLTEYALQNMQFEEQIKIGVTNAIDDICKDNNLAKMVEEVVKENLKTSLNEWSLRTYVGNVFEERLKVFLREKAVEFTDRILGMEGVKELNDETSE